MRSAISLANCFASHSTAPSLSRLTATSTSNTRPRYTAQLAPPPMFLISLNSSVARASTSNCSCTTRALPPDALTPALHSWASSTSAAAFSGAPVRSQNSAPSSSSSSSSAPAPAPPGSSSGVQSEIFSRSRVPSRAERFLRSLQKAAAMMMAAAAQPSASPVTTGSVLVLVVGGAVGGAVGATQAAVQSALVTKPPVMVPLVSKQPRVTEPALSWQTHGVSAGVGTGVGGAGVGGHVSAGNLQQSVMGNL
jgi:hypothetical protein